MQPLSKKELDTLKDELKKMKALFELEKSSGYYSPSDDESGIPAEKSVPFSPILKSPSIDKDPTVSHLLLSYLTAISNIEVFTIIVVMGR